MRRRKQSNEIPSGGKDYRFMSALARGLSVLHVFGPDNRPLGNAEIAQRTRLAKATVSRITFTLTTLGYLKCIEDSGKYYLTPSVLTLGYDVMARMEIRDLARPYMQELADYADASVNLGVPHGLEFIYIEACRSVASMTVRLGVGSRIPLPTTAMGRAYLAALPDEEREQLIMRIADDCGEDWPNFDHAMRKAVARAKEQGFSTAAGDWLPAANSAGAMVCRSDGYPLYGVNIGGMGTIITRERLQMDLGPRLLGLARQIEHVAHRLL